jgi:hypothetical protein
MRAYTLILVLAAASLLSSCKKNFACNCGGNLGSVIAYKPGTEAAAKDSCTAKGCAFTEY